MSVSPNFAEAVTTRPVVTITMTPHIGVTTSTNLTFSSINSTPGEGVIAVEEWQLNNNPVTSTPPSGILPAGSHTVRLRVQNSTGTWSAWAIRAFGVAVMRPRAVISMTPQTGITTSTNLVFNSLVSTPGEGTIIGAEWQLNDNLVTTTPPNGNLPAGVHTVRLRVRNNLGTWSTWTIKAFGVTAIRPTAVITMSPITGISTSTNLIFNSLTSTPGEGTIAGVEWQLNNNPVTTTPPSGSLPAGMHTVRLRVRNSMGTWSAWTVRTFNVAVIQPRAVITLTPPNGITTTTNVAFTHLSSISGEGTIAATEWQINNEAIRATPPNRVFPVGSHTVRLRIRNSVGTRSPWTVRVFNVGLRQPTAVIEMSTTTGITKT